VTPDPGEALKTDRLDHEEKTTDHTFGDTKQQENTTMGTRSMNTKSIPRLMLANDNPVERIGLQGLLARRYDLESLQETMQAQDIINRVKNHRFDLIILDSSYRRCQRGEILRMIQELKKMNNPIPIMIMGTHNDRQYAFHTYLAGVTGFVDKACPIDEFMRAIDKVLGGKKYVSPMLEEYLAEQVAGGYGRIPGVPLHQTLSSREFEVMQYMIHGMTQTEIAEKLRIHRKTVFTYKSRIFEKMHVENLTGLITYALLHGLISQNLTPDDYSEGKEAVNC